MDLRRFHRQLADAALPELPAGAVIVCAVSGGADSMAMLHGLVRVDAIHAHGWRLHVAHLDHRLRDDATKAARFVAQQADTLGLGCTVESADVAAHAARHAQTIEEAARNVRYAFLARTAESLGAPCVAVGHHADDQAETVLHRIARGTGIRGLSGMPPRRPIVPDSRVTLVRPMLAFRRATLRSYLDQIGGRYCADGTNRSLDATRNRIRHDVLPRLREMLNPNVDDALLRLATQAASAEVALDAAAAAALRRATFESRATSLILNADTLTAEPHAIRQRVVRAAIERVAPGMQAVGHERIEAVVALLDADGARRTIELADGVRVERRGHRLAFRAAAPVDRSSPRAASRVDPSTRREPATQP